MIQFMKKSCKKKFKESSTADSQMSLKQQFMIAITLSLLFGLGWGIGLLATQEIQSEVVRNLFSALFILLTAFQGLFIFLMHCIRSKEVRKEWKRWFYKMRGKDMSELTQSSTSSYWQQRRLQKKCGTMTETSYVTSGTLRKSVEAAYKISPGTIQLGIFDDLPAVTGKEIESTMNGDPFTSQEPNYDSTQAYRLPSIADYGDSKKFRSSQLTLASRSSVTRCYENPLEQNGNDAADLQLKDIEKALGSPSLPMPISPLSDGTFSPGNCAYLPNPFYEPDMNDGVCNGDLDTSNTMENHI